LEESSGRRCHPQRGGPQAAGCERHFVQDSRLKALEEEKKQIESNLQLLGAGETTAALDFRNQLSTSQLLLEIEIGDASFRVDELREFLGRNF